MFKKPSRNLVLVIFLLIFTGGLRKIRSSNMLVSIAIFVSVYTIYIGMLTTWGISLYRRIKHEQVRLFLISIAGVMLFWIFIRTIKWGPFNNIDEISRLLWYAFYIPLVLIPLLSFIASLYLARPETWKLPKSYLFLFLLAFILIALVISNDFHQLAFRFKPDMANWDKDYTYGVIYFLVVFWIMVFTGLMLFRLYKTSYISHTKKRVWMPLVFIGVGILYSVLYAIDKSEWSVRFVEMTAMFCFLVAGVWESCIQVGLLPSNTKYEEFFDQSNLAMQIVDSEGTIHYTSKFAPTITKETFLNLKEEGSITTNPNTLIHSSRIKGGYAIWSEDITELSSLIRDLETTGEQLKEGITLIEKEIETKTHRLRIEEQNRLYNLTIKQTENQIEMIRALLENTASIKDLYRVNLLGTYIKRRGNLVLISEGRNSIDSKELERSINETFQRLSEATIECQYEFYTSDQICTNNAIIIYDFLHATIDKEFLKIKKINTTLKEDDEFINVDIQLESNQASEDDKYSSFSLSLRKGGCSNDIIH